MRGYRVGIVTGKAQESLLAWACCLKPFSAGGSSGTFRKQMFLEHQQPGFSRVQIEVLNGSKFVGFLEQ
jgi:hypothetical protein